MRQFEPALDSYRAVLALTGSESDAANEKLVRPLHGLGLTLQALGRDEESLVPLKRAVDIIRNREGLFAVSQLPLLQPLSAAYTATQRLEEAGSTQQYAFTIAENTWGKGDPRLLEPLDGYARWNESVGRYSFARVLHARAVQIAEAQPQQPLLGIDALRGLARTHRLAFVNGESEEAAATAASASLSDVMLQRALSSPSTEGERALRIAIERLRAMSPVDSRRLGETLTDYGDWFMTGGAASRARTLYREAHAELASAGAAQLLATPVALTYRPPGIAVSRGSEDAERFEAQTIELRVNVDAEGEVREASVPSPVATRESAERAVINALRRARFRPAIVNGDPVAATDVAFTERVWVRRPD